MASTRKEEEKLRPIQISDRPEEEQNPGISALQRASRIAEEHGISDMSLDEINAEIAESRKKQVVEYYDKK